MTREQPEMTQTEIEQLRAELEQVKAEIARLRAEVARLKLAINPSQKPWTPPQANTCLVCGQDHVGLICPQLIVTCRSQTPTQGDV